MLRRARQNLSVKSTVRLQLQHGFMDVLARVPKRRFQVPARFPPEERRHSEEKVLRLIGHGCISEWTRPLAPVRSYSRTQTCQSGDEQREIIISAKRLTV